MAGVKPQQSEYLYSGWNVGVSLWLRVAPGSGYSYLESVVESIVDISIINISTQSMNLLQ